MKTERLTTKILENFKPEEIVYAEFAEGGAMGDAGTVRFYTIEKGELKFYLVGLGQNSSEDDIHTYANAYTLLRELEGAKKLVHADGGFGNHAWKPKDLFFARDDDAAEFLLELDGKEYRIEPSVKGVYFRVVADFAKRLADVKALQKFRKKVLRKSSNAELVFYDAYLEQVGRNDRGLNYFDIDVDDYWSAIEYIRSINLERFNLSLDVTDAGLGAVQKYRLKYIIEMVGWRTFDAFIARMVEEKNTEIFFELNKLINSNMSKDDKFVFNINNLFTDIKVVSSNRSDLDPLSSNCITQLFEYPVIVKFTDAAHQDILHMMTKASGSKMRDESVSMGYYIANFIFNEDTLSYADILPACAHIIEELPANDPNHVNPEHLFWLAAEVIDRIWRYASETKATQKKCRDMIYDLFYPRVGGIWPILHYDEFKFNEPAADRIFNESVSFLMALDDIAERNEQFARYLSFYRQGLRYPIATVERRAFCETLKDVESSEGKFEKILAEIPADEYADYLSHPDTVKEAAHVLAELFRTDEGARITGCNRIRTFEQLLLNGNSIGVGVAILNDIVKNFEKFSEIVTKDSEDNKLDPLDVITSLYTAAAAGSTEENEIPPLKALTKKISRYVIDLQIEQTMNASSRKVQDIRASKIDVNAITEAALRYARKHRRTILFQRSDLQKLF